MKLILSLSLLISAVGASSNPLRGGTKPYVGGYVLLNGAEGLAKLSMLANDASSLPINRLWLAFFSPTMVYYPGSNTLNSTGLDISQSADAGFSQVKASIATLQASGIDVLLSMGGWDFNCFPYAYTTYSVGGYGPSTPNYWEINEYCAGSVSNGNAANEYCYTCEPPSANETSSNFGIFSEPSYSPTWQQAVQYVTATAGGSNPPVWDATLQPGQTWTDPKTGVSTLVPGSSLPAQLQRDPYMDIVLLAKDLGAVGIDVDYEEMWHADMNKYGSGPWTLPQTVYKYSAILKDVLINIEAIEPSLLLSTAGGAASGWSGNWWGGNLKGVLLQANQWYPDLISYVASTGGVNVMTYDLSDNEQYYECPEEGVCALNQQVNFYMGTYASAGIPANVGYETGTPAYPSPIEDPTHQLPLTSSELSLILQNTQGSYSGGFFWEIFKQPQAAGELSPTQLAQALCAKILPGSPRCAGSLPTYP